MSGLIGKKIGMTSIFDENGKNIPCTVIEAGPCIVTQVRTEEVDGYSALQLGFDDKAEKRANKAEMGHVKKAGTSPKKKVVEFRDFEGEVIDQIFAYHVDRSDMYLYPDKWYLSFGNCHQPCNVSP